MKLSTEQLQDGVRAGDVRAVARLITLVENRSLRGIEVLRSIYKHTGQAKVVGITGSPGAGKSTLVDVTALRLSDEGKKVAVVAVDPTSPFSGGAVLGDRVRMSRLAERPEVFIRSLATRGALGGLSHATLDVVTVLDAAGFDYIFIETVGVGQAEVDIVRTADTTVVVLVPGMGDSVQAMKAGVLEIADVFVINKADRDGADLVQKDLRTLISLVEFSQEDWRPLILQTIAPEAKGVEELRGALAQHAEWLERSTLGHKRRRAILRSRIIEIGRQMLLHTILDYNEGELERMVDRCFNKESDPYASAEELIRMVKI